MKKLTKDNQVRTISLVISQKQYNALVELAEQDDRTISWLIRCAVAEYLKIRNK